MKENEKSKDIPENDKITNTKTGVPEDSEEKNNTFKIKLNNDINNITNCNFV